MCMIRNVYCWCYVDISFNLNTVDCIILLKSIHSELYMCYCIIVFICMLICVSVYLSVCAFCSCTANRILSKLGGSNLRVFNRCIDYLITLYHLNACASILSKLAWTQLNCTHARSRAVHIQWAMCSHIVRWIAPWIGGNILRVTTGRMDYNCHVYNTELLVSGV
jgi:hypothetical protein